MYEVKHRGPDEHEVFVKEAFDEALALGGAAALITVTIIGVWTGKGILTR